LVDEMTHDFHFWMENNDFDKVEILTLLNVAGIDFAYFWYSVNAEVVSIRISFLYTERGIPVRGRDILIHVFLYLQEEKLTQVR
jgi:hypothetical protein